jgi:hypothetical protein
VTDCLSGKNPHLWDIMDTVPPPTRQKCIVCGTIRHTAADGSMRYTFPLLDPECDRLGHAWVSHGTRWSNDDGDLTQQQVKHCTRCGEEALTLLPGEFTTTECHRVGHAWNPPSHHGRVEDRPPRQTCTVCGCVRETKGNSVTYTYPLTKAEVLRELDAQDAEWNDILPELEIDP